MAFRNVTLWNSQQRAASTFMVEDLFYSINKKHAAGSAGNDSVCQTKLRHIRDGQLRIKHGNKLRSRILHLQT